MYYFYSNTKVVALCDVYPEKAEAMKEKYHLDCKIYNQHDHLLEAEKALDIVHICTPPYVHAEIAIDVMNAGINVLVEKPMATCLEECDKMLEAEKNNSVQLACIAQNRFRKSVYKLKELYDSGIAGKVCCAHVNSFWWRGHSYYDLWWRGTWEKEGGGPTLNHAVHHIDMLNWIMDKLPVEVTAILSNVMHDNSEVEDISLAAMRYDDGSVAQVTSSVIHHGEEQGITLQCADAKLAAPWSVKADISLENGFYKEGGNKELVAEIEKAYRAIEPPKYEGHAGEIDNVLRAIENGERPLITGEDGRKTVELITAIYKAGNLKEVVKLPISRDDEYYTFEVILKHVIHFYEKKASIENFSNDTITVANYS